MLEALLDGTAPVRGGARTLHHLLATPFRQPPLRHGSRFGSRHEPGLWYGAEELRTALAETAYYRILFVEGTAAELAPLTVALSAFQACFDAELAIDVSEGPFRPYLARICSPVDYSVSQALGSDLRGDGIEAVRFPSARDPAHGMNVGLFTPTAFCTSRPLALESWLCTVTLAHDVQFRRERVAAVDSVQFERALFLVDGVLPSPTT